MFRAARYLSCRHSRGLTTRKKHSSTELNSGQSRPLGRILEGNGRHEKSAFQSTFSQYPICLDISNRFTVKKGLCPTGSSCSPPSPPFRSPTHMPIHPLTRSLTHSSLPSQTPSLILTEQPIHHPPTHTPALTPTPTHPFDTHAHTRSQNQMTLLPTFLCMLPHKQKHTQPTRLALSK